MAPPDPFSENAALIERAISHVCRRNRLSGPEGEDFASSTRVALIENDHARIRAFAGRSSLQTYLIVIITRLFQDWRNAQWGKWRPSAEAKRLGPLAVKLETLIVRDKRTFEEACETLLTNHGVAEDRTTLEALAARFPARTGRTFTDESALETVAATGPGPDAAFDAAQAAGGAADAASALKQVVGTLPPQDRVILKMRFHDDFSVAEIAKVMKLEQKPLYRRIDRLLSDLRAALEARGLDAPAIRAVIEDGGFESGGWESCGEVRLFDRGRSRDEVERVS